MEGGEGEGGKIQKEHVSILRPFPRWVNVYSHTVSRTKRRRRNVEGGRAKGVHA